MSTEKHEQWTALTVRRPGDVPPGIPLLWQAEKRATAADRLTNRRLPTDFPYEVERGTATDALMQLAMGESIRRQMTHERGSTMHEALRLGATWAEVAAALDISTGEARAELRTYAAGQRHLYQMFEDRGEKPIGFTAEQHRAVLALTELADDEPAEARPRPGRAMRRPPDLRAAVISVCTLSRLRLSFRQPERHPSEDCLRLTVVVM